MELSRKRKIAVLSKRALSRVCEHPLAMGMPGAVYGALRRLCEHYWLSNCSPLPDSDSELQLISRAVAPIWAKHSEKILRVFADIKPELDRYYQTRRNRIAGLRISRGRSVAALATTWLPSGCQLKATCGNVRQKKAVFAATGDLWILKED